MITFRNKLHMAETAMLISLCFTLCLALWGQKEQTRLAEGLVRLHVIAHSDDEYEQQLKLRVRDAVLDCTTPLLENAGSAEEARRILLANIGSIRSAAEKAAEGRKVELSLSIESYPTRNYGSFALPAGKYTSLRVMLGDAGGQNWWCVIFPPLCSAAASDPAAQTLGEDTLGIITGQSSQYVLRFRCAELFGQLSQAFFTDRHK